ncbi:Cof-type HAD-IIB family hydrolase [soil metagenome]
MKVHGKSDRKRVGGPADGALGSAVVLPLICLDVDGTLVGSSGAPTEVLWTAAAEARARGQRLTLCTARLAAGPTREWAARLDPDGWHIFHTGAARWNPGSGEVRTHPLGADVVAACVEIAGARGWVLETYSWDDYVVDSDDPLAVQHAGLLGLAAVRRPVSDLAEPIVRVQFVVPISQTAAALAAAPPGCSASAATSPVMRGTAFVSITVEGISKAGGIAEVAQDLGVGVDRVMMVGDGHNDLPAIESVGWGVAMANAEPEVIAAARLLVGDVDRDGAAEAIRRSAELG